MQSDLDPLQGTVTLDRIEPTLGERILGVRLALAGTMTEEYSYRISQTLDMARNLQRAPFNPFDAWMVYESRYRAAIRFPLPVTTFTTEQCHKIQQPFILQLLAKLGINRHTSRAIVYGPKRLGGLEIMDLRCEQPAMHYNSTLGHIRRQDRAGKGLTINIADLQAEIGSAHQVFELDPAKYNYGAPNTRMQYLWKIIHERNCTMQGWDTWVPTPAGEHDQNLMDTAVADIYFRNKNNSRLKIINNCRLYLGAVFLSDIDCNGHVPIEYLNGTAFAENHQVQRQPRLPPSARAWTEWKAFIFRNFLVQGYTIQVPISYRTYPQLPIQRRSLETDDISAIYDTHKHASLQDIVQRLPTSMIQLLGTVTYPLDNGAAIASHIINGTAKSASDGSVIHTFTQLYGGYAATLQPEHDDTHAFTQYAPCPHSSNLSSTTTEIYGYIAAVILLHVVCISHGITEGACTIYIDNQTAGKRGEEDLYLQNIGDFLISDYDISALLRQMKKALRPSMTYQWVNSHQDELPTGEPIHGPFLRPVQMNRMVDVLAATGRNQAALGIVNKPIYSTTGLQLYAHNGMAIDDFGQHLVETHNGTELHRYYLERRGWTTAHLATIDWEALSLFLTATPHTRRMKIAQLQHGWQNTGYQKLQFLRSKLQGDEPDHATMSDHEVYCPHSCGQIEHRLHYMRCTNNAMQDKRTKLRTSMLLRLNRKRTDPQLLSILSNILIALDDHREPHFHDEWVRDGTHPDLTQLIKLQSELGWDALWQGFLVHNWSTIQQRYIKQNHLIYQPIIHGKKLPTHDTIEVWKRYLAKELVTYTMDCWQYRNDTLHAAEEQATTKHHRQCLIATVRTLYEDSRSLTRDKDKKFFRMPCRLRVRQHTSGLQTWADTVGLIISNHRERTTRDTIDRYLCPPDIPPGTADVPQGTLEAQTEPSTTPTDGITTSLSLDVGSTQVTESTPMASPSE